MKFIPLLKSAFFLLLVLVVFSFSVPKKQPAVLVFSKTNGYRHASIPVGIAAIKAMGVANKFTVDATEDSLAFTDENLSKYKVDRKSVV